VGEEEGRGGGGRRGERVGSSVFSNSMRRARRIAAQLEVGGGEWGWGEASSVEDIDAQGTWQCSSTGGRCACERGEKGEGVVCSVAACAGHGALQLNWRQVCVGKERCLFPRA
jgi:hypothetical protein